MIQIPIAEGNGASAIPLFVDIVLPNAMYSLIAIDDRKLLRFQAPNGVAVSIPLDDAGVEGLIQALKGTNLSIVRG